MPGSDETPDPCYPEQVCNQGLALSGMTGNCIGSPVGDKEQGDDLSFACPTTGRFCSAMSSAPRDRSERFFR